MDNSMLYKIAITKIPNIGSVNGKNIISYCGGAKEVFNTSKKQLLKIPGIGPKNAQYILKGNALEDAKKELNFVLKNKIKVFYFLDDNYPKRLSPYHDSPIILYYKGNADLNHYRNVGIVGTRKVSPKGEIITEQLVKDLAIYNPYIISGLAHGVDGLAHKTSINIGLPTIGVLGHGFKHIYPPQHRSLSERMLEHGGLLTEHGYESGPEKMHFPMRNRIIAGLSDAIIVVETALKGGSIITAKYANNYNKDVFAIPGRIGDTYSKGCNLLIKSHQAALLENAKDIGYIMRWDETDTKNRQTKLFIELDDNEKELINCLREHESIGIDHLTFQMKSTPSMMAALLLGLEFKGLIKPLPGKRFMAI